MGSGAYETDLMNIVKWPLEVFAAVKAVTSGAKITTLVPSAAAVAFFVWYGGGVDKLARIADKDGMEIAIQYFGAGAVYVGVCMATKTTIDSVSMTAGNRNPNYAAF